MKHGGGRRVLLPASTPLSFAVLEPVFRALEADRRVRFHVTCRHGGRETARRCMPGRYRYVPRLAAALARYDLVLCPSYFFRSLRGSPLVEMFHGVSPKNYAVRRESARFAELFLIGEYHRRKFVRAGLLAEDDPRGVRIGMPKTDPLVTAGAAGRTALLESLDLDPARPLVLYAPTRSGDAGSSIDLMGLGVIDALAAMPVNVVVKLHDRSDPRYRREAVDHAGSIAGRAPRVRLYRGHDVVPCLAAADVLVSDLSSVTNEFLLRDRPIVYLEVPRHEERLRGASARRFGEDDPEDLDYLRQAGEVAQDPAAVQRCVERALADPAARSAERRERAQRMFYNPGRATAAAANRVRGLLHLDGP